MKLRFLTTIFLAVASLPCFAGIRFTATTTSDSGGDVTVRALVSGHRAKVDFLQSGTQLAATGDYMLSLDQGATMLMVSPSTKTYSRYDLHAMMSGMGSMVQGMRGMMKVTFDSPKVEKLLEEDGGLIAGVRTRHYKYRTSYAVSMHMTGDRKATTEVEEDIWTTTQLTDPALAIWLKKSPPATGDEQLDAMIGAEMDKVQGFPVRRITVTHEHDVNGNEHNSRVEMRVTELKRMTVPAAEFVVPKSYKEVPNRRAAPDEE